MTVPTANIPAMSGHGHAHDLPSVSVLRERGKRLTAQRAAIWDVLAETPDLHLSAEDVATQVNERLPHVNPSTVYRTLDVLVEEGLVRRTDLGTGRRVYEPAHEHLHHHLVCERCGSVTHIHDEALGEVAERIEAQFGFRIGEREVTYFGTCGVCSGASPPVFSADVDTERTQ